MVPLMMLLTSPDANDSASGIIWPRKPYCTSLPSSWPQKYNDAIYDPVSHHVTLMPVAMWWQWQLWLMKRKSCCSSFWLSFDVRNSVVPLTILGPFIFRVLAFPHPAVAPGLVLCAKCILPCKHSRQLHTCCIKSCFGCRWGGLPYIWAVELLNFIYVITVEEQGPSAQHFSSQCLSRMASLNQMKCTTLWCYSAV